MLGMRLDKNHWPVVKPFLSYLRYIRNDQMTEIQSDQNVVRKLKDI